MWCLRRLEANDVDCPPQLKILADALFPKDDPAFAIDRCRLKGHPAEYFTKEEQRRVHALNIRLRQVKHTPASKKCPKPV